LLWGLGCLSYALDRRGNSRATLCSEQYGEEDDDDIARIEAVLARWAGSGLAHAGGKRRRGAGGCLGPGGKRPGWAENSPRLIFHLKPIFHFISKFLKCFSVFFCKFFSGLNKIFSRSIFVSKIIGISYNIYLGGFLKKKKNMSFPNTRIERGRELYVAYKYCH
jgi:hypothetical protein